MSALVFDTLDFADREENMQSVLDKIKDKGYVEIQDGVYLTDKENLTQEQYNWNYSDEAKNLDLTAHCFWIITDDGIIDGFDTIEDALQSIEA